MRVQEALRQGFDVLEKAGVPSARLAAEVLLMYSLRCDRTQLYAHGERELSDTERVHYARYLTERMKGKPTQYITGRQEFWGLEFRVGPEVLIPRPETEHVVERVILLGREMASRGTAPVIVDVGTGSGCIAIAVASELPRAQVAATDISAVALDLAAANAERLAIPVRFSRMDLLSAVGGQTVDIAVSNPPYVPQSEAASIQREIREHEPAVAVFAGERGMEMYERLVPECARVLRPGGWAVFELGFALAERVTALFSGWSDVQVVPDLAGIPRVISARKIESSEHRGASSG